MTVGETKAEFRVATPAEKEELKDKDRKYEEDKHILVSGQNEKERRLPDHFNLSDGNIMKRKRKPSVIDHKKHAAGTHDQMYADMFLYLPWDNEEEFLGEARRSEEVCKAMWGSTGEP